MENNDKCCQEDKKEDCCSNKEKEGSCKENGEKDCCCGHDHSKKEDMLLGTAQKFCDDVFPQIWEEHKEKLENLDKKELAQEMFFAGSIEMLASLMHQMKQEHTELKEEE